MKHSTLTRALRLLAACFALSASAHAGVVLEGGGLALVEEGGVIASGNLSALGTSTAFAKDLLSGYSGTHEIAHLKDQNFGNGKSWIGNSTGTFAGVSFGGTAVPVSSFAFGRDNNGVLTDRTLGLYTLQYTTQPSPTNATTAWTTIGTLDYQSAGGTNFASPSKRHRYTFNAVLATGIRLLVPTGACIDELEAYGIVVTTTADELDATSSTGAGVSLREAVRDATNASGADTITFAPSLSGQTITLTTALGGEIILNSAITIDASSLPAGITINGGPGTNRIFSIPASQTVTLNRLTLTGGGGTGALYSEYGGAILNASTLLTLNHCSFQGNSASFGGGIANIFSSAPTLNNCSFQGNSASTYGGGIYNLNSSSPTLNHCSFQGNSAQFGGGIVNNSSSPTLNNCSFQGNSATDWGGGIANLSSSAPSLTNCSFLGNSASVYGGGIVNDNSSPTLTNCSFLGNRASVYGGGIYNHSFSSPTLNNCSFQGNSADQGGGILNAFSSSPSLNNCIIWNNKDSRGTGTDFSSVSNIESTPTYFHCLIQGYSKAALDDANPSGNNLEPSDPLFVREVDPNLAPTTTGGDLRLLTGSPALNAGDDTKNSTTTDLAGNLRKVGRIDLGAYEGNVDATFALLHPSLSPSGDANGNGITNFGDYAAGGNPSAPDDPSLRPKLIGNQLTFSFRDNAEDIAREFQKSTTLLPGSWMEIETADYSDSSTTSSGGRSLQTLTLNSTLLNSNPKLFFREEFTETP